LWNALQATCEHIESEYNINKYEYPCIHACVDACMHVYIHRDRRPCMYTCMLTRIPTYSPYDCCRVRLLPTNLPHMQVSIWHAAYACGTRDKFARILYVCVQSNLCVHATHTHATCLLPFSRVHAPVLKRSVALANMSVWTLSSARVSSLFYSFSRFLALTYTHLWTALRWAFRPTCPRECSFNLLKPILPKYVIHSMQLVRIIYYYAKIWYIWCKGNALSVFWYQFCQRPWYWICNQKSLLWQFD